MVSPLAFVSRLAHITSGALVIGHAFGPFFYLPPHTPTNRFLVLILAGISLLSGLYNLMVAKPSSWRRGAGRYRALVYGKIPLLFALTPTFDKLVGSKATVLRAVVAGLFILLGTSARFQRESQTLAPPK